jgi:hypothetical protein
VKQRNGCASTWGRLLELPQTCSFEVILLCEAGKINFLPVLHWLKTGKFAQSLASKAF